MLRKKRNQLLLLLFLSIFQAGVKGQMNPAQVDSMKRKLLKTGEDTNKVALLMNLGNETGYTDLKQALAYALEGFTLSNKLNYEKGIGDHAYLAGITYMDLGDFALCDSFLAIAEKQFILLDDKRNQGKIADARGGEQYMRGNYLLSADYYSKAADSFDKLKDTVNSLTSYQNLIAVLAAIHNYKKAVELSKKILPVVEKSTDPLQLGYTLQGLVTDLICLEKSDEASLYLNRLLVIGKTTIDQNLSSDIYSTIGTYYFKKNDFRKAADFFKIAVQKSGSLDNKYQAANHYNSLGQAYGRMGDFSKSVETLNKGIALAREYKNKSAESDIALSLSAVYDSLGAYKEAYENLFIHTAIYDSILGRETRNYTTQLETQYETNKKENEILRLQKVQQLKDFEIKKRNTLLFVGAALISALVIILYLFIKNHKTKQKLAKQQAVLLKEKIKAIEKEQQVISLQSMINGQENERTRIAKDLHDGLGGIFSTVKMHYSTLQQETPAVKENPLYRKTLDLINNASDELRRVAHNMMPEVLMKVGLTEALQDFCSNISSGKLLLMKFQAYGMEKRLNSSTEIMLFRIVQELANNIIKHASATEAIIQLNRDGNRLSLIIEDNGRGFDTKEAEDKRSMGMTAVKSRVDYLNGRLTIDSRKDIGTTVMIDLLINEV